MRGKEEIKKTIEEGKAVLGIEFGSTRIKAVLIDEDKSPIASGSYDWENQLVDNIWTYSMEKIQNGLQGCYQDLVKDVEAKYNVKLTKFAALGVSAMMHGYLAFDENDKLLVPFRTWRNTITEEASEKLTELFSFFLAFIHKNNNKATTNPANASDPTNNLSAIAYIPLIDSCNAG